MRVAATSAPARSNREFNIGLLRKRYQNAGAAHTGSAPEETLAQEGEGEPMPSAGLGRKATDG